MPDAAWSRFKRREVSLAKVHAACLKARLPICRVLDDGPGGPELSLDLGEGDRLRVVWGDGRWVHCSVWAATTWRDGSVTEDETDDLPTTQAELVRLLKRTLADVREMRVALAAEEA